MNVIYIDVLVILNLYVTFFLIKAICIFLHKKIKNPRIFAASLFGGISSTVILIPALHFSANLLIKALLGFIIVLICFGYYNFKTYLRYSLIFIIINLLFAGMMLAVWLFSSPFGMIYNNGIAYFDISLSVITVATVLAYGIIRVLRYILDAKMIGDTGYNIVVSYNGAEANLTAFPDTGNTLTDFFTGLPVIICDKFSCENLIPSELDFEKPESSMIKGVRLLPYSTVGSSGLLPVIKPERVVITDSRGIDKTVDALVGISKERLNKDGINALFNPKLLL